MVYGIGVDLISPIKIGYSGDPWGRCRDLNVGHSETLRVLATLPGMKREQDALHRKLHRWRIRGEWFKPSVPVLAALGLLEARREEDGTRERKAKERRAAQKQRWLIRQCRAVWRWHIAYEAETRAYEAGVLMTPDQCDRQEHRVAVEKLVGLDDPTERARWSETRQWPRTEDEFIADMLARSPPHPQEL